jgi:DNA-binding transcriptional MerR regulator
VSERLRIGEVAALTGLTQGRIRHYDALGLVAPGHLESGYRTFGGEEVVRLLHIALLRDMGVGLAEIRASLRGAHGQRELLERHRAALTAELRRLETLVAACDAALRETSDDSVVARLAAGQRGHLGTLGRLERPLSQTAAARVAGLLQQAMELPVAGMLSEMVLPAPVTELLERLLVMPGHEELFRSLGRLAQDVMAVVATGDAGAADDLGRRWVREQLARPPSEPVLEELRRATPRLRRLTVIRLGFKVWAESIHPLAAAVLSAVEDEARRHDATVLGAIVVPPRPSSAATRKASTSASTLRLAQRLRASSTMGSKGP